LKYQRDVTKKMVMMMNNLKKFKTFYKQLGKVQKDTLIYYKGNGFMDINSYLYNGLKIKDFMINSLFIKKIKKYYSENTKSLLDLRSINPSNIKPLLELHVNKNIVEPINILDGIMQHKDIPKLTGNEVLYRGTRGHSVTSPKSRVGDEVIFNNFMSTSTELGVSENFAMKWNHSSKSQDSNLCCMYMIYGLKDIPYLYIPWNIIKAHEFEKTLITQVSGDEFEYLLPRGLKFKITKIESKTYHENWVSTKKLSFSKLDKIVSATKQSKLDSGNNQKLDNNNVRQIFEKTNLKITTYHLEYVSQETITNVPNYVFTSTTNIHIEPTQETTITQKGNNN
jgi:hypothetical protein